MKQKITLEIENDTGVEFEEQAVEREVQKGDWVLNPGNYGIFKWEPSLPGCRRFFVLTPKVDHELEEAKRKFPVGSYYTTTERMSGVFAKVESVERVELREKNRVCVITSDICSTVDSCTPFPIPTWRCCYNLHPKISGNYFTREKESHDDKIVNFYSVDSKRWANPCDLMDREWLDEGGE